MTELHRQSREHLLPIRSSRRAGFTLIEMLVAVAVMGIMLGTAGTAIHLLSNAASRGARQVDHVDMATRGLAAVRNDIARMQRATRLDKGEPSFVFEGDAHHLRFVVVEPAYPSEPGTWLLTYSVRQGADSAELVRSRTLYDPDQRRKSAQRDEDADIVVLQGPYRFEFSYYARVDQRQQWVTKWTDGRLLPELIRLQIGAVGSGSPALPGIVVRTRIDAEATCMTGPGQPCTPRTGRLTAPAPDGNTRWEAVPK